MTDKMLAQDEIDALFKTEVTEKEATGGLEPNSEDDPRDGSTVDLTGEEKDALGEVGNICMGAAATTMSALLGHKVSITSPQVHIKLRDDLLAQFTTPYLVIEVRFTVGLSGSILLVVRSPDAAIIADLMMGNDGTAPPETLGEMEVSAAAEAVNQMIGASATALAGLIQRTVSISPPITRMFESAEDIKKEVVSEFEETMVVISFHMQVGELIDTELLQIMTLETAREEAALLWQGLDELAPAVAPADGAEVPAGEPQARELEPKPESGPPVRPPESGLHLARNEPKSPGPPPEFAREKLDLILDLPLKITVVLGRSRRPIKEVLGLAPGSVLELATLADEPVEILANGALVAWGEVVVVNDNFGVRITSIISPRDRIQNLRGGG